MDKISELLKILITRWTKESPKKYKIITNICLILGLISSIVIFLAGAIPTFIVPAWIIPIALFFVSFSSKLTVK